MKYKYVDRTTIATFNRTHSILVSQDELNRMEDRAAAECQKRELQYEKVAVRCGHEYIEVGYYPTPLLTKLFL